MPEIIQRMSSLRNKLVKQVQNNNRTAAEYEAARLLKERQEAKEKMEANKKSAAKKQFTNLIRQTQTKLNSTSNSIAKNRNGAKSKQD